MSPTLSQKFTAEAIGTAILVFIGAGSVPLTVLLTGENPFGSSELSTISFCFAFAIFAAVYSVGHISGAHINPAVTIALLATRKIDSRTAGVYIVAQVVGAIIGAVLTYVILIGNDPVKLGLGAVTYNADTSGIAVALAAETIGTAILVFTVFGAAVDGRAPRVRGDHHRVHRLRDHHPRRADHRCRPQSCAPVRAGARPVDHRRFHEVGAAPRLHHRPDRGWTDRRVPVRVHRSYPHDDRARPGRLRSRPRRRVIQAPAPQTDRGVIRWRPTRPARCLRSGAALSRYSPLGV